VKFTLLLKAPSLTLMVMTAGPENATPLVTLTVRFAPLPPSVMMGARMVSLETAVTIRLSMTLSTSFTTNGCGCVVCPRRTTWFVGANANTGASFTGVTVRMNWLVEVSLPSLTIREMVAEPVALVAGVIRTVRLLPEPLNSKPDAGTRAAELQTPLTVRTVRGDFRVADGEGDRPQNVLSSATVLVAHERNARRSWCRA
jgi:hypothetical protein